MRKTNKGALARAVQAMERLAQALESGGIDVVIVKAPRRTAEDAAFWRWYGEIKRRS